MKNAEQKAEKAPEAVRKTVYLPKELYNKCETLFPIAMVDNFSSFTVKALNHYIDSCIMSEYSDLFADNVKSAIEGSMAKLSSRISKGMYRYAIALNAILKILSDGYDDFDLTHLLMWANRMTANQNGRVDLKILSEQKTHDYCFDNCDDEGDED